MMVCLATFCMLAYINYRVVKIVGSKDMPLVMMLIALKLAVLSFAIFYGFEASVVQYYVDVGDYWYCMNSTFTVFPSMFLASALFLTLNKWAQYILIVYNAKKLSGESAEDIKKVVNR